MGMRFTGQLAGVLLAMLPLACTEAADQSAAETEDPLTAQNGLTSNGLTSNGLTSNGLTSNGLTSNGLSSSALAGNSIVLTALRDTSTTGDNSRLLFKYLVSCSLPATATVSYTWTDSGGIVHAETDVGGLGLAPSWQTGSLNQAGQELVSACLAARTNSLGLSVPISMRANGVAVLAVADSERAAYTYGEGSFWGNLFATSPYLYSCSRAPYDAGITASQYTSKGRTCAASGCGAIKYLGRCLSSDHTTVGQTCFDRDKVNDDWSSDCYSTLNKNIGTGSMNVITTWLLP